MKNATELNNLKVVVSQTVPTKQCRGCGQTRPVTEYHKHPGVKCGLQPRCKDCYRQYVRDNKDVIRERRRVAHLRDKFGLTNEQYQSMFETQGGVCALCGLPPTSNKALAVDHDHRNGKIRSLLCIPCNAALGSCRDSVEIMRRMIQYIEHNGNIDNEDL